MYEQHQQKMTFMRKLRKTEVLETQADNWCYSVETSSSWKPGCTKPGSTKRRFCSNFVQHWYLVPCFEYLEWRT